MIEGHPVFMIHSIGFEFAHLGVIGMTEEN